MTDLDKLHDILDRLRRGLNTEIDKDIVEAEVAIKQWATEQVVETEKAYGGCTKCYGKGYATVNDRWIGHDTDQDIGSPGGTVQGGSDFAMKFCTCDRGKQLEAQVKRIAAKARIDEGVKLWDSIVPMITNLPDEYYLAIKDVIYNRRTELKAHLKEQR